MLLIFVFQIATLLDVNVQKACYHALQYVNVWVYVIKGIVIVAVKKIEFISIVVKELIFILFRFLKYTYNYVYYYIRIL